MNVLFLGGFYDEFMEQEIISKSQGFVHFAANKQQELLIEGLQTIDNMELDILSAIFVGAYPMNYKDFYVNNKKYIYKSSTFQSVNFINMWGIRNISRKRNLINAIKGFAKNKKKNKSIIIYSPHTPFLEAAVHAKKIDPTIHICLFVPDLPQFMNLNKKQSFVYKFLKKIDIRIFNKNLKYVDSFVLLTEQMKEMINLNQKPYIVIEGFIGLRDLKHNSKTERTKKSIVYTGTLNKKFGILHLIEAFLRIKDENIILEICGAGDSEDIVKKYAQEDNRIVFLGQLSNNDAVLLQENATILVNPRQNNEEYTKYSFPSKNMEYLITGNPVVAYKLDGIPDEYDNYIFYIKDNNVTTLVDKLKEILDFDNKKREKISLNVRTFMINNKNNILAANKIIDLIYQGVKR